MQIDVIRDTYVDPNIQLGRIAARLPTLQHRFSRFHRDEEIRFLFRGNNTTQITTSQWNGNEWKSFWHIAMLAFCNILNRNDLAIW